MGLSQALFSAISGLVNHQRAMDNIGNNLANVNTVAFKKGVFQFRTLLEQTLRGGLAPDPNTGRGSINPMSIGLGTQTGSINKDFRQGSMEVTGNQRDMAIEGNGYFVLRTGNNRVFTRDGTFYLGADGSLLGNDGLQVQGVLAEDGVIPVAGNIADLIIPIGQTGAAQGTTVVGFTGNLDSDIDIAVPNAISDDTWLNSGGIGLATAVQTINIGHVETSEGLHDASGGATTPATDATLLEDVEYLRGTSLIRPFAGIAAGDQVTISFRKGGRRTSAMFTYGAFPNGDGTTLGDFARLLTGGLGDATGGTTQRLVGGAMGTVHVRQRTISVDGYDATNEHAGAFMRTYTSVQPGAVDYDNDGTLDSTNRISIASNLGAENAITDIEISFSSIKYTDMFAPDINYGTVTGGSTSTNLLVYDSLGNSKNVTVQMTLVTRNTNFSTWRWLADSDDDTDAGWNFGTFNDPASTTASINIGAGLIRFDSEGRFVRGTELSETQGLSIDLVNQGVNTPLSVSILEGLASSLDQDLDFSSLTQVSTESDFNLKEQDGSPPGTLDTFTVTSDGVIQGIFSNGIVTALGRISIALIPNEAGLVSTGNNLFLEGPSSGAAQIAFSGLGGRGAVRAGQLESSNVDLSEEFTKLITTQRGFQANARVITTADEMLVELVNMKR